MPEPDPIPTMWSMMDRSSWIDPSLRWGAEALDQLRLHAGLPALRVAGRCVLPVVQGGMGVGVSAGRLAGTVASLGGWGTISSVDLRRLHPDLLAQTRGLDAGDPKTRSLIDAANRLALERELCRARELAGGRGLIAVNIMRALSDYEGYVRQALDAGADALVVGAGLPLDLADLAREHPQVALVPILSDARGVQLLIRRWQRRGRVPDAVVIEHPRLAGGHLGAARIEDLQDGRFEFEVCLPAIREFLAAEGLEGKVPLIAAGGIRSLADIKRVLTLGADAVQLGTPFAVTEECDAAPAFKTVLAEAREEDMVEFLSVAGLPARAVRTPWLTKYLRMESRLRAGAHAKAHCKRGFDCLAQCGLRDGDGRMGQFCIDQQLGHALDGDTQRGLFFRGTGSLPFGERIRPVADLMAWMLGGLKPGELA